MLNKQEVITHLRSGKTMQEVGTLMGVSRQRIGQIKDKYMPKAERREFGYGLRTRLQQEKTQQENLAKNQDLWCRDTFHYNSDLDQAQSLAFSRKKQNTKRTKHEWTIKKSEVYFPTYCPIIGIELDWFAETRQENSPSFDRVDNSKGYVAGNVIICSWRANRIKNDGTAEEHRKIADYLDKY